MLSYNKKRFLETRFFRFYYVIFLSLFVLTLTLLLTQKNVYSNDFFVAKNGNDSNLGTDAAPWLTIQHAADSVSAGDTVYIKSGTYTENITIKSSGSNGNEICFMNYNSDSVIVIGQFILNNQDYITFEGFNVGNGSYGFVETQMKGYPGSDYITIEDCTIQDTSSYGIYIARGCYVTVKNCTIKDTGNSCINLYGQYWTIEGNDISNPAVEDGIHIGNTDVFPGGHVIRSNYIHNVNGIGHVDGIQLVCGSDIIIEYNILENCRSSFIMTGRAGVCEGNLDRFILRYNLMYLTQDFDKYTDAAHRVTLYSSQDFEIVGNIIAYNGTYSISALFIRDDSPPSKGIIRNNIFYKLLYPNMINGNYEPGDIDYNCYYGASQGTPAQNDDTGAHSLNVDPNFLQDDNSKSPGNSFADIIASGFLKLDLNSPIKDAGIPYSGKLWQGKDIAGVSIPKGDGWPIGALEFISDLSIILSPKKLHIVTVN